MTGNLPLDFSYSDSVDGLADDVSGGVAVLVFGSGAKSRGGVVGRLEPSSSLYSVLSVSGCRVIIVVVV